MRRAYMQHPRMMYKCCPTQRRGALTLTHDDATQTTFAASATPESSNCIRRQRSSSELKLLTVFLALCAPPGTPAAREVSIRIPRARDGAAMYRELEYDSADDAERGRQRNFREGEQMCSIHRLPSTKPEAQPADAGT